MTTDRDRRLARVLVEFAHTLGTDFSIQAILDHLVQRIVDILPVTGAGVMLMPVHPLFPRACADGLAAVFTFPMRLDAGRLGALDLYRDTPGALVDQDLAAAQVLADVAAAYLFNAQARVDASAAVARLNHRSLHDPLTGLPNRTLLEELLDQAVAWGRRSRHPAAVLFADLDGFKPVNDRYGHHVGDQLLSAVAARISMVLRPGDTLPRLGGDEFVVLCEDLRDSTHAETVASRIITALTEPFPVAGHQITISASVGIAFSGPDQDIAEGLLRDADFAMYQAKNSGGGRHQLLDPAVRLAADCREALENDLAQAQDRGQLYLVYQPIVDIRSGGLESVEALLRWEHPQRGSVPPDVVIPSAERTGMILRIGEWVLRQACQDLQRWQAGGQSIGAVAVNVSAAQVMGPAFVRTVQQILTETGADPPAVCLEVTESVFLADAPRALTVLRQVKELGVGLSLDDFGTGYSSLRYLRQFPVDVVKIDRSFTADVPTDKVTRSVVNAIIDLSHALDLTVTAEGVETAAELTAVADLGADHVQGFHLSRLLASEQLVRYAAGDIGLTVQSSVGSEPA